MHTFRFLIRDDFPYPVRRAIRKAAGDATPERELFRAIVCRSIADAYGRTGCEDNREHADAVREAREWWRNQDEDWQLVISASGIDPTHIIPIIKAMSLHPRSLAARPRR